MYKFLHCLCEDFNYYLYKIKKKQWRVSPTTRQSSIKRSEMRFSTIHLQLACPTQSLFRRVINEAGQNRLILFAIPNLNINFLTHFLLNKIHVDPTKFMQVPYKYKFDRTSVNFKQLRRIGLKMYIKTCVAASISQTTKLQSTRKMCICVLHVFNRGIIIQYSIHH